MDRRLVVLALVSYALALLAKETAALFPFFCLAWFVSARLAARTSGPRPLTPAPLDWLIFATLVVITTGYLTTRAHVLGPGLSLTPDVGTVQFRR